MTVRAELQVIRAWSAFLLVGVVLGALVAFVIATVTPAMYASRVGLLVAPPLTRAGISTEDVLLGQALAPTYAGLAVTRPILDRAIASTGIPVSSEDLAPHVTTSVAPSSNLLYVTVSYTNSSDAIKLANAIASQLVAFSQTSPSDPTTASNITVSVIDPAIAPADRVSASVLMTVGLGAAVGLLVAVSSAFLIENLRSGRLTETSPVRPRSF